MDHSYRSLGIDLGVPNTALTLIAVEQNTPPSRQDKKRWKAGGWVTDLSVVSSALLLNPLSNLTDNLVQKKRKRGKRVDISEHQPFEVQLDNFLLEARWMISRSGCDRLTAERFIGRGFTPGGALPENIAMMNMGFVSIAKRYRSDHSLVSSAIWKNQLRRTCDPVFTLEDMYDDAKARGVSTHSLDSFLIALFGTGDCLCYKLLLDLPRYHRVLDELVTAAERGF